MSFPRVIHSPEEAPHIDQVRFSKALTLPLNQSDLVFQLIQKLNRLVFAAIHFLHDLSDRIDDINCMANSFSETPPGNSSSLS